VVGVAALLVATAGAAAFIAHRGAGASGGRSNPAPSSAETSAAAKLRRDGPNALVMPPDTVQRTGLRTAVVGDTVRPQRMAPFPGTLAPDNDAVARARSRFAGEVVCVGAEQPPTGLVSALPVPVPRVGDHVRKGELLAVVWSKDLGEKKSELVEAASRLRTGETVLARLREGERSGSIPPRSVWDAERAVESDRIALDRAERTLRVWRLNDDEIAEVRAEADRLRAADARRPDTTRWARVEVRAPRDGVIVEKNVNVGDIVDTTTDLFKIADLSRLAVWAHVYEDDLPLLAGLKKPIRWTVSLPSRPGVSFPGTLDQVSPVIDPTQHTALATGHVENANGELKVGQFVTVLVALPPPAGEVELPAEAVVEDGKESAVFVQPDPEQPRFVRTRVEVTRRFRDGVCVKADGGVKPGDRVVTAGALLLREAMEQLPPAK
jgi:cobalt-zinc-cadmium efflux system membrane fusion protein